MSYRIKRFTATVDGLVPKPGSSTGLFLKDDGTWAAASGSGGTTTNALTITNTGGAAPGATFNGSAAKTIDYSTVGAQQSNANLTAYAGANWSAGVQIPALTAANTIALKTVGSASGNILDKAAGDALYQPLGTAMVLISEVVTSGSQASVTFSSISSSYRDLIIVVRGRMSGAVTNQFITLQFNSDTGTNYHYERFEAFHSSTNFAQSISQTSGIAGELAGASATANYAGVSEIRIGDYRGTTFFKHWTAKWSCATGTGTFTQGAGEHGGTWASTSAINAVKVAVSSGNFVDGSVVSLYGCM